MKLKRIYKVGTPVQFKWTIYHEINAPFVIKDGIVESIGNLIGLDYYVIKNDSENKYYCVFTGDVI